MKKLIRNIKYLKKTILSKPPLATYEGKVFCLSGKEGSEWKDFKVKAVDEDFQIFDSKDTVFLFVKVVGMRDFKVGTTFRNWGDTYDQRLKIDEI